MQMPLVCMSAGFQTSNKRICGNFSTSGVSRAMEQSCKCYIIRADPDYDQDPDHNPDPAVESLLNCLVVNDMLFYSGSAVEFISLTVLLLIMSYLIQ